MYVKVLDNKMATDMRKFKLIEDFRKMVNCI
jgi:hypothetical protein